MYLLVSGHAQHLDVPEIDNRGRQLLDMTPTKVQDLGKGVLAFPPICAVWCVVCNIIKAFRQCVSRVP